MPRVWLSVNVEIWSDVVCPWCYLGKRHFEQAVSSFGRGDAVEVVYRSFELDQTVPRGVTEPTVVRLAGKYGMSAQEAHDAQRQMEQRAALSGLEFHLSDLQSGNTRDAHRMLHLAKERGLQTELMERLHRAYFTEQRSIFEPESLTELAVEVGLDAEESRGVIETDQYADAVAADEETPHSIGVTGVPFFVIDRKFAISGAQPAEVIVHALEQAQAEAAQVGR